MLISSHLLALSRCYTLKRLAETYVQRHREQVSQSGVLHGETLVFVTTAIVATVAEVESGSTFRETCLATEVKKVSRNRPCYRDGATPAETCFATPLLASFS